MLVFAGLRVPELRDIMAEQLGFTDSLRSRSAGELAPA